MEKKILRCWHRSLVRPSSFRKPSQEFYAPWSNSLNSHCIYEMDRNPLYLIKPLKAAFLKYICSVSPVTWQAPWEPGWNCFSGTPPPCPASNHTHRSCWLISVKNTLNKGTKSITEKIRLWQRYFLLLNIHMLPYICQPSCNWGKPSFCLLDHKQEFLGQSVRAHSQPSSSFFSLPQDNENPIRRWSSNKMKAV